MSRMSQKERGRIISQLGQLGIDYDVAAKLLRYGTTLQRLAEASCNGDYPADNGSRNVVACDYCQGMWVRSSMYHGHKLKGAGPDVRSKRMCPDCRTEELARALCAAHGLEAHFQGDPRGSVFYVVKDGRTIYL